jgi:general secretion pathway protein G
MTLSTSSRRRRGRGFTLIEVLMVLAILVIIAGLAAANLFGLFASGQVRAARAQFAAIETALDAYRLEWGQYPPSLEVLLNPMTSRDGRVLGGNWLQKPPLDPWNNQLYFYQYPSSHGMDRPDIWCVPPDGNPIGNWQ